MFDTDGNGVIDSAEWERGKRVLATEFFKNNQDELWKYGLGEKISHKKGKEENTETLLASRHFAFQYLDLKKRERMLRMKGSREFSGCMDTPGLTKGDSFNNLTKTQVPTARGVNTRQVRTRSELLAERRRVFTRTANETATKNYEKSRSSSFDPTT